MKEITDKELLQLQLDILKDVDTFCRRNRIEYFLVGGTGIGAVRHGGYIPWDDDIDIGMTRPNYDKFLESFNGTYGNLRVYAPELNINYYASYANVCDTRTVLYEGSNSHRGDEIGVKIDVFPYDGVPSDFVSFDKLRNRARNIVAKLYYKRYDLSKSNEKGVRFYVGMLRKKISVSLFSYAKLQRDLISISKHVKYSEAEYLEKIVFPYKSNRPCKKEIFECYCDMPFENLTVRNLTAYDEYLTSVFGDYMQLPPENQRVMHHGFKAYWKEL